jgi:geranylgeranyl pyrophosphate synthase
MYELLKTNLQRHLKSIQTSHSFSEVLNYAVLPPGKLFRPGLVCSLANDLGEFTEDHALFASAIEIHHAYTLIHDDLPSMDNDDFRRGKPSTHKKFNEWKAILAGDALLSMSYQLLAKIENKTSQAQVLTIFTEMTGPRGLILGQVKDLELENDTLEDLIEIHQLKTGNLIALSLIGSSILSQSNLPTDKVKALGLAMGVSFQLIDDLIELTEELNQHEKDINPYLKFDEETVLNALKKYQETIQETFMKHKLTQLEAYYNEYYFKMKAKVLENKEKISKYIKVDYKNFL